MPQVGAWVQRDVCVGLLYQVEKGGWGKSVMGNLEEQWCHGWTCQASRECQAALGLGWVQELLASGGTYSSVSTVQQKVTTWCWTDKKHGPFIPDEISDQLEKRLTPPAWWDSHTEWFFPVVVSGIDAPGESWWRAKGCHVGCWTITGLIGAGSCKKGLA